jgi:hypothetical protein
MNRVGFCSQNACHRHGEYEVSWNHEFKRRRLERANTLTMRLDGWPVLHPTWDKLLFLGRARLTVVGIPFPIVVGILAEFWVDPFLPAT